MKKLTLAMALLLTPALAQAWPWSKDMSEQISVKPQESVDPNNPGATLPGRENATLRNLRDPQHGPAMRVDIALQGPTSREVLLKLSGSEADKTAIKKLGVDA